MENVGEYWLVIIETKGGEEHMSVPDRIVKIWGGNSFPKQGEILSFPVEKGKKQSKVVEIDVKEKKIRLKGVNKI